MNRLAKLLILLSLTLAPLLGASPAMAGPKDAAALKLDNDAINNDYLATNFAEAAKKLQKAIKTCGASGCSAQVLAQLHRDLGIVYMVGLQRPADGKTELAAALKADPGITLDEDLAPPEVQAAFKELKSGGGAAGGGDEEGGGKKKKGGGGDGGGSGGNKPPGGDFDITPPKESAILTPVPIYVEIPETLKAVKVQLRYKPFGATEWKTVEMRKAGEGYVSEVACLDVGTNTGDLKFYIQVMDAENEVAATAGTRNAPYVVPIKRELDGEAPHLPNKPPPKACQNPSDCPPGFPGCSNKPPPAEKVSCETTLDCPTGATCEDGHCQGGREEVVGEQKSCESKVDCDAGQLCGDDHLCVADRSKYKRLLMSLSGQIDLALISGKDVCSMANQDSGRYACYDSGGPYYPVAKAVNGDLVDGTLTDGAGTINGGLALGSMRLMVGLDYALNKNMTLGLRAGYAVNGAPKTASGKTFFPAHLEARATYWFGKDALAKPGIHPFAMASGGLAEVDVKVRVKSNLDIDYLSAQRTPTAPNDTSKSLYNDIAGQGYQDSELVDAWKKMGQSFVSLGGGLMYATSPGSGFVLDVRLMFLFPTSGTVFAPEIGYVFTP